MMNPLHLLYIDDDATTRASVAERLSFVGIEHSVSDYVTWLQSGENCMASKQCVVWLGQCSLPISVEKLLEQLCGLDPLLPLIAANGWEELDSLDEPLRSHVVGRLDADAMLDELMHLLHRAVVYRQMGQQIAGQPDLFTSQSIALKFEGLVGMSNVMALVRKMISQVADRDVNVLITGESGTGKEVVANNLHRASKRSGGPFVPVNCGAIPSELLESELFGHEKGAFTGAIASRAGRFELADGGTLFLDEIGDMPVTMQIKLLRVLQERCFERVGGTKTIECDVRIIAATHKDLETMIEAGTFREDLYYRLNVFPIEMPALRERVSDIPLLVEEFCSRLEADGFGRLRFHKAAIESLQKHKWSGNIRELANLTERLAILYPGSVIGVSELPAKFRHVKEPDTDIYQVGAEVVAATLTSAPAAAEDQVSGIEMLPDSGLDMKKYLEGIEQAFIEQALDSTNNVVARAADKLQIRRTTLVEKMRKYGIQRK
ncbi:MAG: sigma-54 dependent transcriptional regulator [Amphritea sp.]